MKKIEAVIRNHRLSTVIEALKSVEISGLSVFQVLGQGAQEGYTEMYRGQESEVSLLPKVKVEIITSSNKVDDVIQVILDNARTGELGDGKIWVSAVEQMVRVRTGEESIQAL